MFASVAEAGVTTNQTSINLTAGDSAVVSYTLSYNGVEPAACHVYTNITPDGIGFNLSYNHLFVLYDGTIVYNITINTNAALKPLTYNLTAKFDVETPNSQVKIKQVSVTHIVYVDRPIIINNTSPPKTVYNNQTQTVYLEPQYNYPILIGLGIIVVIVVFALGYFISKYRNKRNKP